MNLVLAALLAATALQAAAPKHKLEFTAKSIPADEKKGTPPCFRVEGTTDYPDNTRLRVFLHFGDGNAKAPRDTDTIVKDGKFTCDVVLFLKRNLPSAYSVRIIYNPHFQQMAAAKGFPPRVELISFRVGTEEDRLKVVREVAERLIGVVDMMSGLTKVVEAEYRGREGKPFNLESWKTFFGEFRKRIEKIVLDVRLDREYRFTGFHAASEMVAPFRNLILDWAWWRGKMLEEPGRQLFVDNLETTRRMYTSLRKNILDAVKAQLPRPSPSQCIALAREAGGVLDRALGLSGEALKEIRTEYTKRIMKLHANVPPIFHEKVLKLIVGAKPFFAALESERKEEAQKSLGEVKRLFGDFEEAIRLVSTPPAPESKPEDSNQD